MGKAPRQKYNFVYFNAAEAFPASNPLAIDLLRLMAAYNDISEVIDWVRGTRSRATKKVAFMKARIRMTIQHRLLHALTHEAFCVVDQMQGTDEFKKMKEVLSDEGKSALRELQMANVGGHASIRSKLSQARNTVAFHYDSDTFKEGMEKHGFIFAEEANAEAYLFVQPNDRAYYVFPERIREITAFGFSTPEDTTRVEEKLGSYLDEVARLINELGRFLDNALISFVESNGIRFRLEVVNE